MMCLLTRRSKHFITSEVKAMGRKSFNSLGLGIFGTGTIVAVFQSVGTFFTDREELKMSVNTGASCSAQYFRTAPPILSGPGLFFMVASFKHLNDF